MGTLQRMNILYEKKNGTRLRFHKTVFMMYILTICGIIIELIQGALLKVAIHIEV